MRRYRLVVPKEKSIFSHEDYRDYGLISEKRHGDTKDADNEEDEGSQEDVESDWDDSAWGTEDDEDRVCETEDDIDDEADDESQEEVDGDWDNEIEDRGSQEELGGDLNDQHDNANTRVEGSAGIRVRGPDQKKKSD
jgi:hypothetical protein